jgi:hypothetical protein
MRSPDLSEDDAPFGGVAPVVLLAIVVSILPMMFPCKEFMVLTLCAMWHNVNHHFNRIYHGFKIYHNARKV